MSRTRGRRGGSINVEISEYVDIEVSEILEELSDDNLIEEVKERGLEGEFKTNAAGGNQKCTYIGFCDFFGTNYHTPISKITSLISEKLIQDNANLLK